MSNLLFGTSGPIALVLCLFAAIGVTEASGASVPGHTKQQHTLMTMLAQHHGKAFDHRKHQMAMTKQHDPMTNRQHKAMMKKMHATHHRGMAGPARHVTMMPLKQAGSCGTYMYRKAGASLDARNKK